MTIHTAEAEGVATLSELETERFGVRAARARVVRETLPRVLDFCLAERVELLVTRCATTDLAAAQAMESHGFLLMDTLVYYGFDLSKKPIPEHSGEFLVRQFRPNDRDQVRLVAARAFKGYMGHYHADPRLDRRQCDETYASWAERSTMLKSAADEVLVAEHDGNIVGFATLRRNSSEEGEGLLFAVVPEYQKRGVCRALMIRSLRWCQSQGATRMVISTQVTNVFMQKVWCRVGFEPSTSYYTFHKWFDR
jgi:GNAT superfamily N-acetyltransferase